MNNSMCHRRKEDNPMSNLSFTWKAQFKNGDTIFQFTDNIENSFIDVLKRFDELQIFTLRQKEVPHDKFVVDLEKGILFKNDIDIELKQHEEKCNIRLIFFRRHTVDISDQGQELEHKIMYHLGFQYNTKDGNNRQIVLQIDSNGNFIIGG